MNIKKYFHYRYIISGIKYRAKKAYYQYHWPIRPKRSLYIFQNIQDFIINQYIDGKFNRFDIIVKLLAIEQFHKFNDNGYSLYENMQNKRLGYSTLESFVDLIERIGKLGFDYDQPISLDNDMQLNNGSHRIANAIYLHEQFISVRVNRSKRNIKFDESWFLSLRFGAANINIMKMRLAQLVTDYHIYFKVIVWPPALSRLESITDRIKQDYKILAERKIILKKSEFDEYVEHVYLVDDIDTSRIQEKISNFAKTIGGQKEFIVSEIDIFIPSPKFRVKHPTNHRISTSVELIKKSIREVNIPYIENYFHDNIVHIGDNFNHTNHIEKISNKPYYRKKK